MLERPPGAAPRPTIIMLHGLNGTGAATARGTGLDKLGPRAGFVAVFPDGLRNRWNFFPPGREPAILIENSRQIGGVPDDAGFLKLLVADLIRRGISDPKRIYLAGTSNGSFMTLRMMCTDAQIFAAIALIVGGMPEEVGADCRPPKPIPVLMFNGTADTTVPYGGGPVQPGGIFSAWPTERLVAFFRKLNDCAMTAERTFLPDPPANKVEVVRSLGCMGGPVLFYRAIGGDHAAPVHLNAWPLLLDFFRGKVRD